MIACAVYRAACRTCFENCHYMLFSNKIGSLVDLLNFRLNVSAHPILTLSLLFTQKTLIFT